MSAHTPNKDPWAGILDSLESGEDTFDQELNDKIAASVEAFKQVETHTDPQYCHWLTELREVIKRDAQPGGHPPHVLYPGSAVHTDVGDIFSPSNVIHVDPVKSDVDVLTKHGYQAQAVTVEEFIDQNPTARFDVIISQNAGVLSQETLNILNPDGYVIANNHHGSAENLLTQPNFRVVAGVMPDYNHPDAQLVGADGIDVQNIDETINKNMLLLFQKSQ